MLYKSLFAFLFTVYIVSGVDDLAADDAGDDLIEGLISSTSGPEGASAELYSTDLESFGDTDSGEDAADIEVSGEGASDDGDDDSVSSSDDDSTDDSDSGSTDDDDSVSDSDDDSDDDDSDDGSDDGTESVDDGSDDDDTSVDAESDEEEDECNGLSANACSEEVDDDTGDAECSYNAVEDRCYSVVRRAGVHGSGNFDDGFIAAQEAAKEEANELYTVVGVLGGIIGALIIVIAGGGYFFYQKAQKINAETSTLEMMDNSGSMGQSNYINNDTSPMIVQQ